MNDEFSVICQNETRTTMKSNTLYDNLNQKQGTKAFNHFNYTFELC